MKSIRWSLYSWKLPFRIVLQVRLTRAALDGSVAGELGNVKNPKCGVVSCGVCGAEERQNRAGMVLKILDREMRRFAADVGVLQDFKCAHMYVYIYIHLLVFVWNVAGYNGVCWQTTVWIKELLSLPHIFLAPLLCNRMMKAKQPQHRETPMLSL